MVKLPEVGQLDSKPIAVMGMGVMGRRLATYFGTQGAVIQCYDAFPNAAEAGAAVARQNVAEAAKTVPGGKPGTFVVCPDIATALKDAWLVVEALPEKIDLKTEVFAELDRLSSPDTILTTNSSSFKSSEMISKVKRPERVLSMHFSVAALYVELMTCGKTDPAYIAFLKEILPRYGFEPYVALKESTGLIMNRIWAAIKREALLTAAEGVASVEDIDALFKVFFGTKIVPFRLMDMVGLDTVLSIEEHYQHERTGLPVEVCDFLKKYIAEGKLGKKSGSGFYDDYKA